ncbi:MAG: CHASE3 domain-containing protein, partial [Thermostichus sp. BF3_bins_97]
MPKAPLPPDEAQRLAALREYHILDTAPEASFDELVRLAAYVCGTPAALVSLIDVDRQWFKAKLGLEAEETPRDYAFCAHALLKPQEPLIVEDARKDERFADNPFVTGDPNVRFYAGIPLVNPEGRALGTLCVIDYQPRHLSEEQLEQLKALGHQVVAQLELRRSLAQLSHAPLILPQKPTDPTAPPRRKKHYLLKVTAGFGIAAILLGGVTYLTQRNVLRLPQVTAQVAHTFEVLKNLEGLLAETRSAETDQRGYLLTNDIHYLNNYRATLQAIPTRLRLLRELISDNPAQQERLAQVEQLLERRLNSLQESIDLRDQEGLSAAQTKLRRYEGPVVMEQLTALVQTMQEEENRLLQERSFRVQLTLISANATFLGGLVFTYVVLLLVYLLIRREIEERERAETFLKQERDFTNAVIDTAGALVVVMDPEGRILRFNRAAEQLSGYALAEVKGRRLWDVGLIPPENIAGVKRAFQSLKGHDLLARHENFWQTKQGALRLISWSNTALRNENGSIEFIMGTGIDITDRKLAEMALKESEDRYRDLFENATDLIQSVDVEGHFLYVNRAWRETLGYGEEEIHRLTLKD